MSWFGAIWRSMLMVLPLALIVISAFWRTLRTPSFLFVILFAAFVAIVILPLTLYPSLQDQLVRNVQCAVAWWYNRRCLSIIKRKRYDTKDGKHAFIYYARQCERWAPPGCGVWQGDRTSAIQRVVGVPAQRPFK